MLLVLACELVEAQNLARACLPPPARMLPPALILMPARILVLPMILVPSCAMPFKVALGHSLANLYPLATLLS
jgi:hypothetical protein